jgi:hypothetical protein
MSETSFKECFDEDWKIFREELLEEEKASIGLEIKATFGRLNGSERVEGPNEAIDIVA